jgi:hypothetical protein
MLKRTSIVVSGLAAVLLSTAAFADSTPATSTTKTTTKSVEKTQKLTERCSSLETQFDQAIGSHLNAAKAAAAKQLRTKGETLCKANNQTMGVRNLTQALKDIGVKPHA